MGSERRRSRRIRRSRSNGGRDEGRARARWRAALDAFGGLPALGGVVAVMVVVGVLIALNRPDSEGGDAPAPAGDRVARALVSGRTEGAADAPVQIVEFSDFQCPFCRRFTLETAPALRAEFVETGVARIEYRHMAFLGEESKRAAEAAQCALEQGFFWEYHDVLFQNQGAENSGAFSDGRLKRFAREIADTGAPGEFGRSLDGDDFDACLDSGRMRAEVERQSQQAIALGVRSTPTFMVNGRMVVGAQPIEAFRQLIAEIRGGR